MLAVEMAEHRPQCLRDKRRCLGVYWSWHLCVEEALQESVLTCLLGYQ
jgi:hypothetical protein